MPGKELLQIAAKSYNLNGLRRVYDDGRVMSRSTEPYAAGAIDGVDLLTRIREARKMLAALNEAIEEMEALVANEPYVGDIDAGCRVCRVEDPNAGAPGYCYEVLAVNREARRIYISKGDGSRAWVDVDGYVFHDIPRKSSFL